ncbi:hypothetical protein A2779_02410, partial [Candidatus Roizmanbacteria bacterium RIFCSPHIGHO2_01_FULL_40_98]
MKKLIFIKFGGSLITYKDKPYTPRRDIIRELSKEIKKLQQIYSDHAFILGNGAGSFGHYAATELNVADGMKSKKQKYGFALVQSKVKELNKIVVDELLKTGVNSISIHPSSVVTASKGKANKIFLDSIKGILSLGMTPVVYGDIVFDDKKGSHIFSTENLFEILVSKLYKKSFSVDKVIYLSIVDGVLNAEKKVIPTITQKTYSKFKKHLYKTEGYDVTGGMLHKVEKALKLSKSGIQIYIA